MNLITNYFKNFIDNFYPFAVDPHAIVAPSPVENRAIVVEEEGRQRPEGIQHLEHDAFEQRLKAQLEKIEQDLKNPENLSIFISRIHSQPSLLEGRESKFREAIENLRGFLKENPFLSERLSQVKEIVLKNPSLDKEALFKDLFVKVTSFDGKSVWLDRSLWAIKAKAWQPFLTGARSNYKPLEVTEAQLETIDLYMRTSTLPDTSSSGLFQIAEIARMIGFEELETKCYEVACLQNKIDSNNVIEYLDRGLITQHKQLVDKCFEIINSLEKGILLHWNKDCQITANCSELNLEIQSVLEIISPYIEQIILNRKTAEEIKQNQITFPKISTIQFEESIELSLMKDLGAFFPKVTACKMPEKMHLELTTESVSSWRNVEVLCIHKLSISKEELAFFRDVLSKRKENFQSPFPNLKICLQTFNHTLYTTRSNEHLYYDRLNAKVCKNNGLTICSFPIEDFFEYPDEFSLDLKIHIKDHLELSKPNDLLTDEVVISILKFHPDIVYLDLSNSKITDKTALFVAKNLRNLNKITLNNCNITDIGSLAIIQNCGNLKVISLKNTNITEATRSAKHLTIFK